MQRTANPCTSVQFRYRPPKFILTALFRLSSAVEQSAVNRLVACSNQAAGAIKKNTIFRMVFFFYGSGYLSEWRPTGACLERVVGSNEPAKFEPYGARRTRLREYPIWQPCCPVEQAKPVSFPPLSLQKKCRIRYPAN